MRIRDLPIIAALLLAPVAASAQGIQGSAAGGNYPGGSVPVGNATQGTTAQIVATLAAATSRLNFLSGFEVTEVNPTAAANITVTVAGVVGGPFIYTIPTLATGAAVPNPPPLLVPFVNPLAATGAGVAITVTVSAAGAGGVATVAAHGYQQLIQ